MAIIFVDFRGFEGDPGDETEENVQIQGGGDFKHTKLLGLRFWVVLRSKTKITRN